MEYSHDTVPTECIPALATATQLVALEQFERVIQANAFEEFEVRAGFLSERKGEFSIAPLGKPMFYLGEEIVPKRSTTEEVVLQLTIRVPRRAVEELIAQARVDFVAEHEAERTAELQAKEAERASIEAEITALQARKALL